MALVVGLVAGCREQRQTPDGAEVITLWQPFNNVETELFREIMKDFERDYQARTGKRVHVDITYVSFDDMFTKLRTAAMANITPDIAFIDSVKVTDLAYGNALLAIDQLPAFRDRFGSWPEARRQYVGASFDAGLVNRLGETNLFGLPVQTTTVALFWNREMFRQKAAELRAAGLDPGRAPRTWDELIEYGRVLTDRERGQFGYGMHGSMWFSFPVFNMYGMEFIHFAEDGSVSPAVVSPRAEAALARLQGLAASGVEAGAWVRGAMSPDQGFINRRYAMILTGPWNVRDFTRAGIEFDIALVPAPSEAEIARLGLPGPAPGEDRGASPFTSSNVGGQTGVILRTARNPDLAVALLDYFTSEPVQRRWASNLGQIPVRLAAWENLDTSKFPFMPIFMEQLKTARRIPQIPLYGTLESEIFTPQFDLLLQQRQTPAAMLKKMEALMQTMICDRVNSAAESARRRRR
jgi:ABC-type glycerol-3-phosphate transport system substrate-binding protein